jgi:gentisate 1,2-dioxygenase
MTESSIQSADDAGAHREFYRELESQSMLPLWERLRELVPRMPAGTAAATLWDYDKIVRPHLMKSAGLISAKEAERRVLILENPGLPGEASITGSLYAGVQLIMPGEVAPAHRHTQSALRFIIEGNGAYTMVDGERTLMRPGDFVLTPNWRWHDHGNETDQPMVWLDGLDIPLVRFFGAGFAESGLRDTQALQKPVGDALYRYGNNLLPVDWHNHRSHSPLVSYPYDRTRESLDRLRKVDEPDPCHGFKMRFANPATGGYPMPTIGAFIQLLPAGFAGTGYCSTDGTVFSVVEGSGETHVGAQILRWKERDIFVVPGWMSHSHHAKTDAVLFSYSDRPAQIALGIWRELRQ